MSLVWGISEGGGMHKLGWGLVIAAVVLEYAHYRVTSGQGFSASTADAGNSLANIDVITGESIHLSYVLGAAGLYMILKG